MNKYLSIIIFLSLSVCRLSSQNLNLTGKISDDKEPLAGTTIILHRADSLIGATITDKKGIFRIEGLSNREYLLSISYLGYQTREEKVTMNKNLFVEYTLSQANNIELSEVVIRADKSNIVGITPEGSVFYLSANAKDSKDIYNALREIPKLIVDNTNRTITLNDGSTPLILINGVRRESTSITTIDPKSIESIEVIENPSARYLTEGVTSVLNIKLKEKQQLYQYLNIGTKQNPQLIFGYSDANYERGNDKYSFYLSGQQFYFHQNKSTLKDYQESGSIVKNIDANRKSSYTSYSISGGGDWSISPKDYFSYSITYNNIPQSGNSEGKGSLFDESQDNNSQMYNYFKKNKTEFYINTYNLYHKHTFDNKSFLETLLRMNLNGSHYKGQQDENGDNYNYQNKFDFKNKRYAGVLEIDYDLLKFNQHKINLGSITNFQKNRIDQRLTAYPVFHYREWIEYLYADISKTWNNRFSYMASIGLNLIYNKSEGIHNNYNDLKYSISIGYKFNDKNSIRISSNHYTVAPSVTLLNPYNTSTDSLIVKVGNPYLEPYDVDHVDIDYTYNYNSFYIEPQLSYQRINDFVTTMGKVSGSIYTQQPVNYGKQKRLQARLNTRYNIKNTGYISLNFGYQRLFFEEGKNKNIFDGRLRFNFYYKKVSLSAQGTLPFYEYDRVMKTKSTSESDITLLWSINDNWDVNIGARYITGRKKYEEWKNDGDYQSYYQNRFKDRNFVFLAGFRYNWRKSKPNRQQKKLYQEEEGIRLRTE